MPKNRASQLDISVVIADITSFLLCIGSAIGLAYSAQEWSTRDHTEIDNPLTRFVTLRWVLRRSDLGERELKRISTMGLVPNYVGRRDEPVFRKAELEDYLNNYHNNYEALALPNPLLGKIAQYTAAIGLEPINADLLVQRGKLYHQVGQKESAVVDFKRALILNAQHPHADGMRRYVAQWDATVSASQAAVSQSKMLR
jgi:tetratricopeptide (TPR) repeat protein